MQIIHISIEWLERINSANIVGRRYQQCPITRLQKNEGKVAKQVVALATYNLAS